MVAELSQRGVETACVRNLCERAACLRPELLRKVRHVVIYAPGRASNDLAHTMSVECFFVLPRCNLMPSSKASLTGNPLLLNPNTATN